jgi:DNA-directed RNA polymerase specialized sigma subunit
MKKLINFFCFPLIIIINFITNIIIFFKNSNKLIKEVNEVNQKVLENEENNKKVIESLKEINEKNKLIIMLLKKEPDLDTMFN